MIIPIGHDREIFHFPYATLTVIVLCFAVQIYATIVPPDEERTAQLQREEVSLRIRLWQSHGATWLQAHPSPAAAPAGGARSLLHQARQLAAQQRQFTLDFEAGRVVPTTHPDYIALQELRREQQQGRGLLRLAYHTDAPLYTLISYTLIHGGWLHLIGNMLFLWLCGCNMEDRWGRVVWLLLYVGGGALGAWAYGLMHPHTAPPLVGASGAIAAAMGAFLVVHYNAHIRLLYVLYVTRLLIGTFTMRAFWALPIWFLQQAFGMWAEGASGAVAYSAHVVGFLFGVVIALGFRVVGLDRRLQRASDAKATVFAQDPLFLDGMTLLERGDRAGAASTLERLLAAQPDHLDGAIQLFRLALDDGPTAAAQAATRTLRLCKQRGDIGAAHALLIELRERQPQALLDDRSLLFLAQSLEKKDPQTSLALYAQLAAEHVESPLVPKALLSAAQLNQRLGDAQRARETLATVIERYPGTAFADRASELLAPRAAEPRGPS
jgi:membrane associated rhomboid family serine protease